MADDGVQKAYKNERFINSPDARELRILAEYIEPQARFREYNVSDTIVFFGSARLEPEGPLARGGCDSTGLSAPQQM